MNKPTTMTYSEAKKLVGWYDDNRTIRRLLSNLEALLTNETQPSWTWVGRDKPAIDSWEYTIVRTNRTSRSNLGPTAQYELFGRPKKCKK